MGSDKAMLRLGGKTLLARAVETLKGVRSMDTLGEEAKVTVIGDRTLLEGADRAIPDRYVGCGPLGGLEAALGDLEDTDAAAWAMFLPVDMPFLSAGLLNALLRDWIAATERGARVCSLTVDDRPQPLVSLIHRSLRPWLLKALDDGRFKVTPVLQSACEALASTDAGAVRSLELILHTTAFFKEQSSEVDLDWVPTEAQRLSRHLWFSNLNTQEDFQVAETFLDESGSDL